MATPGPRYSGWHYDADNTRMDVYYKGTRVAHVNSSGFTLASGMVLSPAGGALYTDDALLRLGADGDQIMVNRSTSLNANTALTSVVIGTPVVTATPANSLITSTVTASGDQVFILNDGSGNSWEYLRFDSSAGLVVFNEASSDIDFRVESDGNANALVIDAGTDHIGLMSAVNANAQITVGTNTQNLTPALAGSLLRVTTGTITDNATAMSGTATGFAALGIAAPTLAASNTSVVTTDVATVYIDAAPTAGTNETFTRSYALLIDAGQLRVDGNVQILNTAAFASTQAVGAAIFQSSGATAPVGAISTGGAIYTDGTVMKKIIAAGTASNIET